MRIVSPSTVCGCAIELGASASSRLAFASKAASAPFTTLTEPLCTCDARLRLVTEIRRQPEPHRQLAQLRPRARLRAASSCAHRPRESQRRILLLRRKSERVLRRRRARWPPPADPRCAPSPRSGDQRVSGAKLQRQRERLRIRHHQRLRQRLDARKSVALHTRATACNPARKRIARRVIHQHQRGDRQRQRCRPPPSPTADAAHAAPHAEILVLHRLRRLRHRRLHQPLAPPRRADSMPRQLHDAEQLIAQPRKRLPQKSRRVFQPALPPDPAMPLQRQGKPSPRPCRAARIKRAAQPAPASRTADRARRPPDTRASMPKSAPSTPSASFTTQTRRRKSAKLRLEDRRQRSLHKNRRANRKTRQRLRGTGSARAHLRHKPRIAQQKLGGK